METTQVAAPPRHRWFAGLRRSRSRVLGGVAGGFADFWAADPLLIRVLVVSPLVAAVFAWLSLVILGLSGLVPVTQMLWLATAATAVGYVAGWLLIPQQGSRSALRRFLSLRGPGGMLVKLVVGLSSLLLLGWLGLALVLMASNLAGTDATLLAMVGLAAAAGLAVLMIWLVRGGDLRDAVTRLGTPRLGRDRPVVPPDSGTDQPDPDPNQTLVLPGSSDGGVAPPSGPTPAPLILDSVDRARAAATAASDARAAAAEAARRERLAARRARRAERRERNRWGWLVAAATLLTAGVLVLTDRTGATSLGLAGIGMICLTLLCAGVLVGAWFGSARWLIVPALVLALAIGAGTYASQAMAQAAAATPIAVAPKSLPLADRSYMTWPEGAVTVDLTKVRSLDGRALSLQVDRGSLTVILPKGQWVDVYSHVWLGSNNLAAGDTQVLTSSYQTYNQPASDPKTPPLYLELSVGVGDLNVILEES